MQEIEQQNKSVARSYRVKTRSIWGNPSRIYFRFLGRLQDSNLPKTLCILGCSDGKFVIPAAKRGFSVLAIDIDRVALFGGSVNLFGRETAIQGLTKRLQIEDLTGMVEVVNKDFINYIPKTTFSGVFTSGSVHYAENAIYPFTQVVESVKKYVSSPGLLLFEYIHRSDFDNDEKRHFIVSRELASLFKEPDWIVTSNKKKIYVEDPNPRVKDIHQIVWGRLYALRRG